MEVKIDDLVRLASSVSTATDPNIRDRLKAVFAQVAAQLDQQLSHKKCCSQRGKKNED